MPKDRECEDFKETWFGKIMGVFYAIGLLLILPGLLIMLIILRIATEISIFRRKKRQGD